MPKTSKYSKQLEDLGFEHLPPERQTYLASRLRELRAEANGTGGPNRKERRALKAALKKPTFVVVEIIGGTRGPFTYVRDELGTGWEADGIHDLSHLKFENNGHHQIPLPLTWIRGGPKPN